MWVLGLFSDLYEVEAEVSKYLEDGNDTNDIVHDAILLFPQIACHNDTDNKNTDEAEYLATDSPSNIL